MAAMRGVGSLPLHPCPAVFSQLVLAGTMLDFVILATWASRPLYVPSRLRSTLFGLRMAALSHRTAGLLARHPPSRLSCRSQLHQACAMASAGMIVTDPAEAIRVRPAAGVTPRRHRAPLPPSL